MSTRAGVASKTQVGGRRERAVPDWVMRVGQFAKRCLEEGRLPLPSRCERCGAGDVAGVDIGLWVPSRELQLEFWGPVPAGHMPGFAVYGMCSECSADPDTWKIVEAEFTRELRAERAAERFAMVGGGQVERTIAVTKQVPDAAKRPGPGGFARAATARIVPTLDRHLDAEGGDHESNSRPLV